MKQHSTLNRTGLLHLSVIYLVWGSTYLAIRVAVREDAGFPPFTMVAMRTLVASALLLGWAKLQNSRIRLTIQEFKVLAISGILLWTGGNGLVTWAEQRVDSGLTALILATMPIWAAGLDSMLERRLPSRLLVFSLLCGFAGVAALSAPVLLDGTSGDLFSIFALLCAPMSWSFGSVYMQRQQLTIKPRVASGFQQLFGGIAFVMLMLIFKEPKPTPITEAWFAWGYLLVFGSIIAFTSYIKALHLLPINITMTYSYVNPVIAVVLGWLILQESITEWTVIGAVLVIAGVLGVFHERFRNIKKLSTPTP